MNRSSGNSIRPRRKPGVVSSFGVPALLLTAFTLLVAVPRQAYADPGGCTVDAQTGPSIQQAVNSGCAHRCAL